MNRFFFYSILTSTLFFCACSSEDSLDKGEDKAEIVMMAPDFKCDIDSRTFINEAGKFTWEENDTVGVFPSKGHQVDFPMINGSGNKSASFDGGGWALKPSSTYSAYYPFNFYNRCSSRIPVNLSGQKQSVGSPTKHLGQYDYMAAKAVVPVDGNVNFNFQHLVSLIQVDVRVPKAGVLNSITISSSDNSLFAIEGEIDLTSTTPKINATKTSKSISIQFDGISTHSDNELIKAYFMVAPVDLRNASLDATIVNNGYKYQTIIESEYTNKQIEAGKAYRILVEKKELTPHIGTWVDLGLPSGTLWATHNVGASSPEEFGEYYAWGELLPKEDYSSETYAYSIFSEEGYLIGYQDLGDILGNPKYDVAAANWGFPAHIPTIDQIKELANYCITEWVTYKGVNGRMVTSKKNGNTIFLPATGWYYGSTLLDSGEYGHYWTTSTNKHNKGAANALDFRQWEFRWGEWGIEYGLAVRPVLSISAQ